MSVNRERVADVLITANTARRSRRNGTPEVITSQAAQEYAQAIYDKGLIQPDVVDTSIGATIYDALALLRVDHGLTVEQVADRMGMPPDFVRRLEAGNANPTFSTIHRWADAVGTTITFQATTEQKQT